MWFSHLTTKFWIEKIGLCNNLDILHVWSKSSNISLGIGKYLIVNCIHNNNEDEDDVGDDDQDNDNSDHDNKNNKNKIYIFLKKKFLPSGQMLASIFYKVAKSI